MKESENGHVTLLNQILLAGISKDSVRSEEDIARNARLLEMLCGKLAVLDDMENVPDYIATLAPEKQTDHRPLWVQMLEKAAMVLRTQDKSLRDRAELMKDENEDIYPTDLLEHGGEWAASMMFFGRQGLSLNNRDSDPDKYDKDGNYTGGYNRIPDANLGRILAYAKQGRVVTTGTIGSNRLCPVYNRNKDSVAFPPEATNLNTEHVYTVVGEGEKINQEKNAQDDDEDEIEYVDKEGSVISQEEVVYPSDDDLY
ncbi:MAG: hypothetical protein K6F53_05075 [Lachnospiraceae bacterium]|nr:hypothetical protein [Lachnospiraceae bacterium]